MSRDVSQVASGSRIALCALLALALTACFATGAEAKKAKTFRETNQANLSVPDRPAGGQPIPVTSTIKVPKKYKGKVVGDVNVTAIQTTGDSAFSAQGLALRLSAPNGRTVELVFGEGGQSIGPLTLDEDTRTETCDNALSNCESPYATLLRPFAGTASGEETEPVELVKFNGLKMAGTWTITAYDFGTGDTNVLNSWGLEVKPAKPVADGTKKAFESSKAVGAPIPPEINPGPSTPVLSEITIPKKYKKRTVGDVNFTLQTTGDAGAADDLIAMLSAPNGRSVRVINGLGFDNIGPLTLDDDTTTMLCDQVTPPCDEPFETLNRPFVGTASGTSFDQVALEDFIGVKMRGTWTLTIWDEQTAGTNSVLTSWGLRVKPQKPVVSE